MKKNKKILVTVLLIFIIFLIGNGIAKNSAEIKINQGKSIIQLNQTIYAKHLILINPEIEYISYFDSERNKSIVYINTFKGIGENFLIEYGKFYEVSSKENITLKTYHTP